MAKVIKRLNGMVIAELSEKEEKESGYRYQVFTKDEWSQGKGYRYEEWQADNIDECIDFIESY